jgi:streptomycin 6-kinase
MTTPERGSIDDPAWRARLPGLIASCTRKWSLKLGEYLEGGYLAAVLGCRGPRGEDLVLKVSPPIAAPAIEARALAHWVGRGTARLVDWDEEVGALLLERIRPGTFLMDQDRSVLDDELAIRAASGALAAMQAVLMPPAASFPSFEDKLQWWLNWARVSGEPDAVGTPMLPLFERCARRLDATAPRKTVAHGDFVAKNLLLGNDGRYVAIDPLPYIGDTCADIGHFSSYHSPVATVVPRARAIAEATGNDADRAAQWAAVWMIGEACETWREDSDDLQAWVTGVECQALLKACLRP